MNLYYYALPPDGAELALTVRSTKPVEISVEDSSNGLPAIPEMEIEPRPPETMPAPRSMADPTIARKTFTFSREE